MKGFVLDCSVVIAWLLDDESDAYAEAVKERLEVEEACAPQVWQLEVCNALFSAMRRKRITVAQAERYVRDLAELNVRIDEGAKSWGPNEVFRLCMSTGLTSYDASYLELATRKRLPLATLDKKLRRACGEFGVALA
ncbi:MAG: type II toxin-antitoxin system VapC family toxin [Candidatus Hydrogenedentota bacterium]